MLDSVNQTRDNATSSEFLTLLDTIKTTAENFLQDSDFEPNQWSHFKGKLTELKNAFELTAENTRRKSLDYKIQDILKDNQYLHYYETQQPKSFGLLVNFADKLEAKFVIRKESSYEQVNKLIFDNIVNIAGIFNINLTDIDRIRKVMQDSYLLHGDTRVLYVDLNDVDQRTGKTLISKAVETIKQYGNIATNVTQEALEKVNDSGREVSLKDHVAEPVTNVSDEDFVLTAQIQRQNAEPELLEIIQPSAQEKEQSLKEVERVRRELEEEKQKHEEERNAARKQGFIDNLKAPFKQEQIDSLLGSINERLNSLANKELMEESHEEFYKAVMLSYTSMFNDRVLADNLFWLLFYINIQNRTNRGLPTVSFIGTIDNNPWQFSLKKEYIETYTYIILDKVDIYKVLLRKPFEMVTTKEQLVDVALAVFDYNDDNGINEISANPYTLLSSVRSTFNILFCTNFNINITRSNGNFNAYELPEATWLNEHFWFSGLFSHFAAAQENQEELIQLFKEIELEPVQNSMNTEKLTRILSLTKPGTLTRVNDDFKILRSNEKNMEILFFPNRAYVVANNEQGMPIQQRRYEQRDAASIAQWCVVMLKSYFSGV